MINRIVYILVLLFLTGEYTYSQHTVLSKSTGTAEAFSRTSLEKMKLEQAKYQGGESEQFKKPNPVIYQPEFEIVPESVISMETATNIESRRDSRIVSPAPDTTFMGLYDSGNSIPPDVNGAPGPDHLMVTLNTEVRIQDRNGVNLYTVSLGLFWSDLPGGGTFDPKILYDFEADRWIFTTCSESTPGQSRLYLGVSATSDPTGEWNLYSFLTDTQGITWFDYPSIGFNSKWIVVSGNMFGNDYYRTVFVFDKQAMFDGAEAPQYTRFATSQGFTLVPAITYDADEPNVYLISSANGDTGGNGYISLFKVEGDLNNPDFSMVGNIGTPNPWAGYVGGSGDFLPQMGSSERLNAVDHRMENVIMRNGKLWAVHHVFLPANNPQRTAVQWWQISPEGELLQRGRIDDPTGDMSYAFATISVNIFEDMLIGYGSFSENQYASGAYSFRSHTDEPNITRDSYLYKAGLAPYYKTFGGGRNRWGDYSATMLDPVNGVDFWVLQEYAELPSGGDHWGTWWAYLRVSYLPVTNFEANYTLIPVGESINFTDLSQGVPNTWNWSFEGAENQQSDVQNPVGILYPTEGNYTVSLTAGNEFGSVTETKAAYITVSSTILPEIHFTWDKAEVCTNEVVKFNDQSLYMPREWSWEFTPSTVSFVNGTSSASQHPEVVFNEATTYSVSLTATNLNGSSSATEFEVIRSGGSPTPFIEYFELETFEENNWSVENPDEVVTWQLTDIQGLDATSRGAMIDFRHYYAIGQRDRLVSPPLDLRGFNNLNFSFKHAYAKRLDEVADSLIILISEDCGESWTRIFADAEDGSGNFATHPQTEDFIPLVANDWCGGTYGSDCINLNLNEYLGKTDVKIAFETFSFYGNPMYITEIELGSTVSVPDVMDAKSSLIVYPNPANDRLMIYSKDNTVISDLKVYSASGQMVIARDSFISGKYLDVSQLQSGVYHIRVIVGGNLIRQKIIIE
jgi:PKD repeat protein